MWRRLFESDIERITRKADAMSDGGPNTLQWYEDGRNHPYNEYNLSKQDIEKIRFWMDYSETLPGEGWIVDTDPMVSLSDSEKAMIREWMTKSENLPLNYEPPSTIVQRMINWVSNSYDNICIAKYEYDLQIMLGEREPWWAFWRD